MDTTTEFLQSILGNSGYYCIFAARNTDKRLIQKFYETPSAAAHAAQQLDDDGFDAYFALGTMATPDSRKRTNVHQMRSFFLDLDCGDGKGFPTQQAALTALRMFQQQYQLPRPTLINSGRGIHAYWPLVEPVPCSEWVPWAERFKRLCLMHKLAIDPVVPADPARVLRVPGTHNHKEPIPKPVVILGELGKPAEWAEFCAILKHYAPESELPAPRVDRMKSDPMMQALAGNTTNRFKTILDKCRVGKGCAHLTFAATRQAEVEEPLWRAALSIASQCVDSEKAIHLISFKHPNYDAEETIRKAELTKGPYHCTSFDDIKPGPCAECPHWGKITSPIQLGREVIQAVGDDYIVFDKPERINAAPLQEYIIPQFPAPYFRGKNGGVYVRARDKNDEEHDVCVYHHDLYVVRRVNDPDLGDGIIVRLHMPFDGVREFFAPLTGITAKDELRKWLSRYGVAVVNVMPLMDYLLKWVNKLEYISAADPARLQFGWTNNDMTSFALGRMLIYKDRIEMNAPSKATASRFATFEPQGSLENWKAAMEFFNRPGFEAQQYMVGCSFGSVLMRMTPINGTIFHLHSKGSGKGKTASLFAAASIWGNPDQYVMTQKDTMYSKMARLEVWKDLPGMYDEMTNIKPEEASDFAYQVPSGQQRSRMATNGNTERYRGTPWKLNVLTTGNTSMIERIAGYKDAPKAEIQRILEYRAKRIIFPTKAETDVFSGSLTENFGHAGIPYLQHVMQDLDHCKNSLFAVQREIDVKAALTAENRFWSMQAASSISGLFIARKLGLLRWDLKSLLRWTILMLQEARIGTMGSETDALGLITEYYADNCNNFLRLRSTDDARGGATGLDHLVIPSATPRATLVGRYEEDVKMFYLLPKPLRQWCVERQISYGGLINELKRGPAQATFAKVRITRGIRPSLPPVNTLVLKGEGWMTDELEQSIAAQAEKGGE